MYAAVLAAPLWLIAVVAKLLSVALPGRRPDWGRDLLRWCAAAMAVAATLVYAIGLGTVQSDAHDAESGAGSAPAKPCRSLAPELLDQLASHEPRYLPLGFDCVLSDGTVVAGTGGYDWCNALTAGCAVAAVLLLIATGFLDELRARAAVRGAAAKP